MKIRTLVTGSTGNLGSKAVARLSTEPQIELIRIGRNSAREQGVIAADLKNYDDSWASHFADVDVVLHLAADPRAAGDWTTVTPLNVDLALNVLRAAQVHGVKRFIFASSNWVLGGYRFSKERLSSALPPKPVNPYGASKLFIERYGLALSKREAMSFLALRIGYCQAGANRPGPHMAFGRWGQEMWLGNRDWEQAAYRAVTAPFSGGAVINIVSFNRGMRWDLNEARSAIGYTPTQEHTPRLSIAGGLKDRCARLRDHFVPQGAAVPSFGARW